MIVQPGLLQHPKFLGLARKIGGEGKALGVLLRLWAHCQESKRGGCWGRVSEEYLAVICNWHGNPKKLWETLQFPMGEGMSGWIDVDSTGCLHIHNWDTTNSTLLVSWSNGRKGGRPKANKTEENNNPPGNPSRTHGFSAGNPPVTRRPPDKIREEKIREESTPTPNGNSESLVVPSVEEMLSDSSIRGIQISEKVARKYREWHLERETWVVLNGVRQRILRPWRTELVEWEAREKKPAGVTGAVGMGSVEELEKINAELQWLTVEKNPGRFNALVERRRELEGKTNG